MAGTLDAPGAHAPATKKRTAKKKQTQKPAVASAPPAAAPAGEPPSPLPAADSCNRANIPAASTAPAPASASAASNAANANPEPAVANGLDHADDAGKPQVLQVVVQLPKNIGNIDVFLQDGATVQDICHVINESPKAQFHTNFYLTFNGKRLTETEEIAKVDGLAAGSVLAAVPDYYNEREAHIHIKRLYDSLVALKPAPDALCIDSACTFLSSIEPRAVYDRQSLERFVQEEEDDDEDTDKNGGNTDSQKQPVASPSEKPKTSKAKIEPKAAGDHISEARQDLDARLKRAISDKDGQELGDFVPARLRSRAPKCLESFSLSAWNPPPRSRKMQGDILYMTITTLEGETFDVTSSVTGFYINASTASVFSPAPRKNRACNSHTLLGLLIKASPKFDEAYRAHQADLAKHHPLEFYSASTPAQPWIVNPDVHSADSSRTMANSFDAAAILESGLSRDWNEEIQLARELPVETYEDRIFRDQTIYRVHTDFVDAAMRSVVGIVEGTFVNAAQIDTANTSGDSQMYIHNNMFISEGCDNFELMEPYGGADATHVALSKDINGLHRLSLLDVEGIHSAGTVVVDYKGRRFVVQTIIPGLLHRNPGQDLQLKYGSLDGGKQIFTDPEYDQAFTAIASAMHLEPHKVVDADGQEHVCKTSIETKGITGTDGRRYIVDLYRTTPVDIQFLDRVFGSDDDQNGSRGANPDPYPYPHRLAFVRHELVREFIENKIRVALREHHEKHPDAHLGHDDQASVTHTENDKKPDDADAQSVVPQTDANGEPPQEQAADADQPESILAKLNIAFNPDAFTMIKSADAPEQIDRQHTLIRELSSYIGVMITQMVTDFKDHPSMIPLDSSSLVRIMHNRGINMRYLGDMVDAMDVHLKCDGVVTANASSINKDKTNDVDSVVASPAVLCYPRALVLQEMVIRGAKHHLRRLLHSLPIFESTSCISHYLNCFYANDDVVVVPPVMDTVVGEPYEFMSLTPASVHAGIVDQVRRRFRFDLGRVVDTWWSDRKVPFLRALAMAVGFQIRQRSYAFEKASTTTVIFTRDDIVSMYPILKQCIPRSGYAEKALDHSRMLVSQPEKPSIAAGLELFHDAMSLHDQVYGPVHIHSAAAMSSFSLAHFQHANALSDSQLLQQRAVVAYERVYGVDAPETVQQLMNLAYIEFCCGYGVLGLRYLLYAFKMWRMLEGFGFDNLDSDNVADTGIVRHPESIGLYANIARMLQRIGTDMIHSVSDDIKNTQTISDSFEILASMLSSKTPVEESEKIQMQGYHYLNLASKFHQRAAHLAVSVYGKLHPNTSSAYEALAMCHVEISRIFATPETDTTSPSSSSITQATTSVHPRLRLAMVKTAHMRQALTAQKFACESLRNRLGDDHRHVVVAGYLLKNLTVRAVEEAKFLKMLMGVGDSAKSNKTPKSTKSTSK